MINAASTSVPMTQVSAEIEHLAVPTSAGSLELQACTPRPPCGKPAVLFLHGAFCSATDFRNFLPLFADRGYPAYSLSIRGHGKSWTQSWLNQNLLTSLDHYVSDLTETLNFILNRQGDHGIFLAGHSFGGGHLQYMLGRLDPTRAAELKVQGLILLAAAPLSGGGQQIMANWELVEAGPGGYKYPWSPRAQLETEEQVRAAFFQPQTDESVIKMWLKECKTAKEGIRPGLSVMWPFGKASDVLNGISGFSSEQGLLRKVLCVAAKEDHLVKPDMVEENAKAYRDSLLGESAHEIPSESAQVILTTVVSGCAHHLMMDQGWRNCASVILEWMEGKATDETANKNESGE